MSSAETSFDTFCIIDSEVVKGITDQAGGDKQFVSMLFESFLAEGQETMNIIEDSIKQNDFKTIREAVHGLKGLAGTMGVTQVFELCKEIDAAIKLSDLKKAESLLPLLNTKYHIAQEYITSNHILV
jgi:HPt (histidine-containing phosphotransfer) domain-containing protein